MEVANTIQVAPVNGEAIDPLKVVAAYSHLGHNPNRLGYPQFQRTQGRDMKFYMQTEEIKNIMIENEN